MSTHKGSVCFPHYRWSSGRHMACIFNETFLIILEIILVYVEYFGFQLFVSFDLMRYFLFKTFSLDCSRWLHQSVHQRWLSLRTSCFHLSGVCRDVFLKSGLNTGSEVADFIMVDIVK